MGIKVHAITRIHNRILHNRFEAALDSLTDEVDNYNPAVKYTESVNIYYNKFL